MATTSAANPITHGHGRDPLPGSDEGEVDGTDAGRGIVSGSPPPIGAGGIE